MVGGGKRGYGGGGGCNNMNSAAALQNDGVTCATDALEAFFISTSSPSIHGSRSMVNFENVGRGSAPERSFFQLLDHEENADEDFDDCFRQPEKKRRLTADQVQFLEKNFEVENKLEPERKIQLAKDLGLQPRQVAIWFQNRRARWKTKQLEKDYDALKSSYDTLKISYENLLKEKEKLKNEVLVLSNKQLISEKEKGKSELQDHLKEQSQHPQPISASNLVSEEAPCSQVPTAMAVCKQEDLSSANSDVFDSDSPHYTDGVHSSSLLEPADSSHAFEPDHSDLSQDEEDNFSKNLVPPMYTGFLKLEDDVYTDQPTSSCNYGFPVVEDQALWFWSC